jgi:hypothetical protein
MESKGKGIKVFNECSSDQHGCLLLGLWNHISGLCAENSEAGLTDPELLGTEILLSNEQLQGNSLGNFSHHQD